MCQINVCNLHDASLNKKLLLLMTSIGSTVHKDGWGISDINGHYWKCAAPMYYTSDGGKIIREKLPKDKNPILGHIRQASLKVPVTVNNSHPFVDKGIVFVHNGKLVPKNEKNFVMEEEVDDLDTTSGQPILNKDGTIKKKKVSISDSLIFFQEFLKSWELELATVASQDERFVVALRSTMEAFTGKFAFVFIINKVFYIVRGKTADLHIVYQHDAENKPTGFIINTSKETLDQACLLMDNLSQLEGKSEHNFTYPKLLKEETIFKMEETDLVELGEIKENTAVTYWTTTTNFSSGKTPSYSATDKAPELDNFYKATFQFMESCSLGLPDIQYIFFVLYRVSLEEVTELLLKHFLSKVVPKLMNYSNKDNRKLMRKALGRIAFGLYRYRGEMEYPWFLNPKKDQLILIRAIEETASKK